MQQRAYQKRGTDWIVSKKECAIFAKMGYGKSKMALDAINSLMWDYLTVRKVIILAPKRVALYAWPEQIEKWAPNLSYVVVHKDKEKEFRQNVNLYVISYSSLPWLYKKILAGETGFPKFDMVILDESTFIKHSSSTRTQLVKAMFRPVRRKVIMAGKPLPNGMKDLWSQIHFLDDGQRLGRTKDSFISSRFIAVGNGTHKRYEPMVGTQDWIVKKLSDIAFTLTKSDELTLPKLIENIVKIDLPSNLVKEYNKLKKDLKIDLDDTTISATSKSALTMKVRQFTSGFIYDEDGGVHRIHDLKYDALVDVIENSEGDNILCAVQFVEDVRYLQEKFPGTPAIYSGATDDQIVKALDDWNAGKLPLMFVNPASVAYGLNLQGGGKTIVVYSLTWDFDHDAQFIARLHRSGQESDTVVVHRFCMTGTVDENMIASLRHKDVEQETTLTKLEEVTNGGN